MTRSKGRPSVASNGVKNHKAAVLTKHKRQFTVYDAVAGRISSNGFKPNEPRVSKFRDTLSSSHVPVSPEEALFRRRGAPVRYEEDDIYWADRHLKEEQKLPESDLLKAIHTYASDFYGRATKDGGLVDFRSLDETALLSLGILLEEMAEQVLGDTGDLAFVEGEEIEEAERDASICKESGGTERALPEPSATGDGEITPAEPSDLDGRRETKKRKTKNTRDDLERTVE